MHYFLKDDRDIRFIFIFWIGLLVIMLVRSFFFGITYFHFLDDYNTYGVFFRRNYDIFNEIILYYRHFTWRPFAFFADAYITQWFWPNMWVVLLFYTLMHFATVLLFHKVMVLSKLNFGLFGIIIISLTPLLAEAVYWIGASTRLVAGMFFSILSVYFLLIYISRSDYITQKRYLVLYILFNLLSLGFYEQVISFNLVFTLFIIFLNLDRKYYYKKIVFFTPIFGTILISIYYLVMSPFGRVGERANIIEFSEVFLHFFRTSLAFGNLLIVTNYEISINGLIRGISLMSSIFGIAILLLLIIYTTFVFLSYSRTYIAFENEYDERFLLRIIFAIVITIAAIAPFYLLQPQALPPRIVYPAIFGISIFLDTILSIISTKKALKFLKPVISVIFIIPFFIIYIAEVNNYRLLEETDTLIMGNFLEAFEVSAYSDQNSIILLNTLYTFSDVTGGGNQHRLENITSSDWAFLGKANATSRLFYFRDIQPIQDNRQIPVNLVDNGYIFGLDEDLSVFRLENRTGRLYIYSTNITFGLLNQYDSQNYTFVRIQ